MFRVIYPPSGSPSAVGGWWQRAAADTNRKVTMPANTTAAPKPLIGPAQLASRLGVSRDHVYRMKDRGTLPPPVRLGHLLRWDPQVIEQWIRDRACCQDTE